MTIVTPTYRRTETLLRAAGAVAAQDYPAIEHLIVGDRCPLLPALEERLREINPEVRVLHAPDWRSPHAEYVPARIARVRNIGIAAASGEYVGHVDSDNTIDPDHVSSLVELLEADPALAGASCFRKLLLPDGSPYTDPRHPWDPDPAEAERKYRELAARGVYRYGTNLAAERLAVGGEPFGIDANEFFFRRGDHLRYLFKTEYTEEERAEGLGEDDELSLRLLDDGVPYGCTERYTLNFYLGGRFTEQALAARGA